MLEERWADGFPGLDVWAPTFADKEENLRAFAHFMRMAASPTTAVGLIRMNWQIDVRPILPAIRVPTLILHRRGERAIGVKHARYLADHIPDAKYFEMPGVDHLLFAGDHEVIAATIEEFLTGSRCAHKHDRMLATVLLAEIVDSTRRAAEGNRRWSGLAQRHRALLRNELSRFRGREAASDRCLATFDGPIRALRCALSLRQGSRQLGLEIRAGVHTGECEFKDDRLSGIALRVATQILWSARPGEILVSDTTKNLIAGSGIEFRDQGLHVLEDLPGLWPLFTVE
jgi:class 3 adenylate cyclase